VAEVMADSCRNLEELVRVSVSATAAATRSVAVRLTAFDRAGPQLLGADQLVPV
jgi:hypothetical protein